MEGGQGNGGGAPESSVGATKAAPNKSDLAGDEGGGMGEAWGGGPWRAGKGGRWGAAPESSVGATKSALVPPFRLP